MRRGEMNLKEIDVAILCGGLGTRLQDVVKNRPKPMATIDGQPFLCRLVEHVASFGFHRFILCLGYKGEMIETVFRSTKTSYSVEFSRESEPLGTAGALRNAGKLLQNDPILVLNGDSFCSINYPQLLDFHAANSAIITIAVTEMELSGDYGQVIVDDHGRITRFEEKRQSSGQGWVNAGIYVFRNHVVHSLPEKIPLSLERDIFPFFTDKRLFAYQTKGILLDIGTPERYRRARQQVADMMNRTAHGNANCSHSR